MAKVNQLFSICAVCQFTRECDADLPDELETPPPESKAAQLRDSKRFMIYVHSKLMIVDDSMAIVGNTDDISIEFV